MSAVLEQATGTVIPDSIEPVEAWRTWKFDGTHLRSVNVDATWKPGEPLKATCANEDRKEWVIVRGGTMSREAAAKQVAEAIERLQHLAAASSHYYPYYPSLPPAPSVEAPNGYGYSLEVITHAAPNTNCACGIYAADKLSGCPSGDIAGKVKLWGTVIPGTSGTRAQYAYPSELHVPAHLSETPALLAYGVPIIVLEAKDMPQPFPPPFARPSKWPYRIAVGANLAACALNLGLFALRTWA